MQIHKKWSEIEISSLLEDYKNYLSQQELTQKYGRSWSAIGSKLYDLGAKRGYPSTHKGYRLPITKAEIAVLYLTGKSIQELSVMCGCGADNISEHLRKLNVPLRGWAEPKNRLQLPNSDIVDMYQSGITSKDISKIYGCSAVKIGTLLDELEIKKRTLSEILRKYNFDESFFDAVDSEEKAYFLGLLYADGSVSQKNKSVRLRLQITDKDVVEKFSVAVKSTRPLSYESGRTVNCKHIVGVTLISKHLVNKLAEFGCGPNKTFTLTFPEWLDPKLHHHFIRGYFDGDGCITLAGGKAAFSLVGTDEFISRVQEIMIQKIGLSKTKLGTRHPERNNNIRSVVYSGRYVMLKIREWLYKDATVYMQRKYDKFFSIPIELEVHRKSSRSYMKIFGVLSKSIRRKKMVALV